MKEFVQFLRTTSETNGNKPITIISYGTIDIEVINDALIACDMLPLHELVSFDIRFLDMTEVVKCHDIYKATKVRRPTLTCIGGSGFSLQNMCKVTGIEYGTGSHRAGYDCSLMKRLIDQFPDFAMFASLLTVSIEQLHPSSNGNVNYERLTLLAPLFEVLGIESDRRGLPHELGDLIQSEQPLYKHHTN